MCSYNILSFNRRFNRRRQPCAPGSSGLIPLLLALLLLGLTAAPVAAHGVEIQDAVPAPGSVLDESPSVVTIIFTEEVIDGEIGLQVLDSQGNAVDDGDVALDLNDPEHATLVAHISRALPDGIYTVSYRVKVLDGDVTEDEFRFAIGDKYAAQDLAPPVAGEAAEPATTPSPPLEASSQSPPADPEGDGSPFLFIVLITIALIVLAFVIIFIARRRSPSSDHDEDS